MYKILNHISTSLFLQKPPVTEERPELVEEFPLLKVFRRKWQEPHWTEPDRITCKNQHICPPWRERIHMVPLTAVCQKHWRWERKNGLQRQIPPTLNRWSVSNLSLQRWLLHVELSSTLICSLMRNHCRRMKPSLVPRQELRRANPTLKKQCFNCCFWIIVIIVYVYNV